MELSQYYDAQVAVLGSLLIEPDRLAGQIFHRVRAEDFSAAELRHIFEAAKEVFLSGAAATELKFAEGAERWIT